MLKDPMQVPTYPDDHFAITIAPLSLDDLYRRCEAPQNGAIVVMSGTVRNQTEGKAVKFLEYQAYEPMAKAVFQQIAHQIRQQWGDVSRVIIHHRIGKLVIGEISVLIGVGSPHRAEAFAACKFGIDTLKHNAPIWKKEFFADGESEWVQGCLLENSTIN
jgi:molybdopterin synthase catalytic subunit